jgi:hypothetical protein
MAEGVRWGEEVPRLRRCGFWLVLDPALTGWANFWRAYGAGMEKIRGGREKQSGKKD